MSKIYNYLLNNDLLFDTKKLTIDLQEIDNLLDENELTIYSKHKKLFDDTIDDRQLYLINDFTIVEFNKELKVITSLYKNLKSKTQELTFTNNTYSDKGKSKFQNIFIMEVK